MSGVTIPEEAIEKVAQELYGGDASAWPGYLEQSRRLLEGATPLIVAAAYDQFAKELIAQWGRMTAADDRAYGLNEAATQLQTRASVLRGEGDPIA